MKNTKETGNLRFMIYGANNHYVGICFELGLVEEAENVKELTEQLQGGVLAILEAIASNDLNDAHLNKRVALKYHLYWYLFSVFSFGKIKEFLREQKSVKDFYQEPRLAII